VAERVSEGSAAQGFSQPESSSPSVFSEAAALWHELRQLAHEQLGLAALETRQAGISLATMMGLAVVAALLLVTAWLTLIAGGVLWMIDSEVAWPWAILVVLILNLGAAALVIVEIRKKSRNLLFSATRRRLHSSVTPVSAQDG
jgi:uncharacterized membrane protein YqjE